MFIYSGKDGLFLRIYVQPGAKKNEIIGFHANALKIRIKAPPIDNAANETLIGYIAEILGITHRDIALIRGQKSRMKILRISGMTESDLRKKFAAALPSR